MISDVRTLAAFLMGSVLDANLLNEGSILDDRIWFARAKFASMFCTNRVNAIQTFKPDHSAYPYLKLYRDQLFNLFNLVLNRSICVKTWYNNVSRIRFGFPSWLQRLD